MSLVLYGSDMWNSPYVLSCFVALREKGLDFEVRTLALQKGAQYGAEYTTTSLTARVPTLVHDGFALSESSAIIEYLEDVFPAPGHARVLPADVRQRARARQVMAWVRSDVGALRDERSSEWVFFSRSALPTLRPLSHHGQRAAEKVVRVADAVIPEGSGPLFGTWCAADTDLAMMLWRLWRTEYPLPPKVRAFAEAQWLRPAVREFVGKPRPSQYESAV